MTGGEHDNPAESDDLGIQITPVDDEFAAAPRPSATRSAPAAPRRAPDGAPKPTAPAPPDASPTKAAVESTARPVRVRSVAREYFEAMVVTLIFCVFGTTFLAQPVSVPTGSMLNTIVVEDHLLVNKFVFAAHPSWLATLLPYREIRRGDVIVFKHPSDPQNLYVKRVIGLPGETVEVYGTRVYINGNPLPEARALTREPDSDGALEVVGEPSRPEGSAYTVYYSQLRSLSDTDDESTSALASVDRGMVGVGKPFTIPEGHYFCLGDNRDNSEDSRFWGTVPRENVVGRAMFVYWSVDKSQSGWFKSARWKRIGTLIQ
jgi:signal peptidase I